MGAVRDELFKWVRPVIVYIACAIIYNFFIICSPCVISYFYCFVSFSGCAHSYTTLSHDEMIKLKQQGQLRGLIVSGCLAERQKETLSASVSSGSFFPRGEAARRSVVMPKAIIVLVVVGRLVFSFLIDLLPEEAYYWNYGQHLALAYFDHPPMVGWIIRAFTAILGDTEFAVRAGPFGCWLVAAYYIYRLTELYSQEGLDLYI